MKRMLLALLLIPLTATAYIKDGYYEVDSNGWLVKNTPVGEVFICQECPDFVQVQISYGPEAGEDAPFHNSEQLSKSFNTDKKKKQFADMLLKSGMPSDGYSVDIIKVDDGFLGKNKAITYSAIVKFPGDNTARETTFVTMHKNRMVKFSANFYEDKLSGKSAIHLDKLYKSIKFL